MSSTISTVMFYIAPSKERHPLVSELFRVVDAGRNRKPRMVAVTRIEGFLTGIFEVCDGFMYEEEYDVRYCDEHPDFLPSRERYEEMKKFFDLYRTLGVLGYISEDYRISWWSSNGDHGSDWENDCLNDPEYQEYLRREDKRKLKLFWQEYPHLMGIIKYGHLAEDHHSAS